MSRLTQVDARLMRIPRSALLVLVTIAGGIAVLTFGILAPANVSDTGMSTGLTPVSVPGAPRAQVAAVQHSVLGQTMLAVVYEQNLGSRSVITLVDQDSGRVLGQITAGDSPLALVRRSRNQLLVSDVGPLGGGRADLAPRLLTFELGNGLAPVHKPIVMPDRTRYPMYSPSMMLSHDEHFLYYMKRWDCGFLCNEVAVGVIDLEQRTELIAKLPVNCGHVLLTRTGPSGAVGMCPIHGTLWTIDSSGSASLLAEFEPHGVYGGLSKDGSPFWIGSSGELIVTDADSEVTTRKNVRAPGALSGLYRWRLDDVIFLGVKDGPEHMSHLVRIDTEDWAVSVIPVPKRTTHVALLPESRLAAVHDGGVALLDASSGVPVRPRYAIPPGMSPWLVGP